MYSPQSVANAFLTYAFEESRTINPMKMQYLVYFAHGWHLGLTGKPLIDEEIEVWKYGPAIPSLYHTFKSFGNNPITESGRAMCSLDGACVEAQPPTDEPIDRFLRKIWNSYGQLSALQIAATAHTEGSPWAELKGLARVISNECLAEYFSLHESPAGE